MEVHHHSHHPKKWKEYLTEFLMLFLAVSLGFLAENIREHYVEKERSHELVGSFIKDVETNIYYIDSLMKNNHSLIMKNDSAVYYLMTNNVIDLDSFFTFLPLSSFRYISNNETYDQMKSSGSLRYIKDTLLLRKIINYNNSSKATEFRSVTQEFEYTAHEYTAATQKYLPAGTAISRQVGYFNNKKVYPVIITNDNEKNFFVKMFALNKKGSHLVSGEILIKMRNELVPVITRKVWLMTASQNYMFMTSNHAKELLEYYKQTNF